MIRMFEVGEKDLASFRGKIRHLRDFGCPPIENPRAGQLGGAPAEYSDLSVFQLATAIALGTVGVSPKASAQITLQCISDEILDLVAERKQPSFLFLFPTSSNPSRDIKPINEVEGRIVGMPVAYGSDASELVELAPRVHAMSAINLAKLMTDLDRAFKQVVED